MAPQVDITIPNTTVSTGSKPYTVYNISLRLPLRSYNVQKRFSDFLSLNSSLTDLAGSPPPAPVPAKTWFSSSVSNSELAEERRKILEHYLHTINTTDDQRWRKTSVWRAFLDLPSSFTNQTSSKADDLHSVLTGPAGGAPITNPVVWLDCHRELKTQLHDARLSLTNRDQASTPQKQHEASAAAKSALVKSGSMITALEQGLENIQKQAPAGARYGARHALGDGEIRRRKDLLASAKKDKDGLENLLNAMTTKSKLDHAVTTIQDKKGLLGDDNAASGNSGLFKPRTGGRVLGKETKETRELDNAGLVQLQKQKMTDQDLDVDELRKIIQRQRELGEQINQELVVQNEMLKMVDEDVDRVQGKIDIAKKRVGKIN